MADLLYYVNGRLMPAAEAALPLNDLGIVRGYGVFDLLRTYGRTPFRLRDHIRRLESSAQAIGLTLPWSTEQLEQQVLETYAANNLPDAAIRIIVTGGPSDNYMTPQGRPTLVIMVHPIIPYPAHYYTQGCKAITTLVERTMPTVKSLNYIGAIMAVNEAAKANAVEAIYLDEHDRLTEGTRANLFVFRGRRLLTPREGVLKGITRQVVMEIAANEYEVLESPIPYRELGSIDEAFLTSTTKEVLPIVQIDDARIGSGQPGPHTRRIMALFREYVRSVTATVAA
ncbi:MAG TPA: aminotransferase class IV [Caldilineaceae bacterium]|nr:aminotransferase class IV [Caldilineaceae bacterium]